jgi:peptidylprolyl isomerase/FKBP-type peptidyl-prolyl cis-trans isomerase FklB
MAAHGLQFFWAGDLGNQGLQMRLIALIGVLALAAATIAQAGTSAPLGLGTLAEQDFLARNAKAAGVVVLPGLQYKILKSGPPDGPNPRRADDITVRYEGTFIDGKPFGATSDGGAPGPDVFPLQKLIPGWVAGLQLMRPGDVWMLYVPSYLAYGAAGKSPIPPGSTLVFKVELIGVAPHVDAPTR